MHAFLRLVSLSAAVLFALAAPALAQGAEDDYDFSEIPVEEEEIPYIGVGGGYQLVMSFVDFERLDAVATSLGVAEIESPLFMHGGGGWTAIGIIPNVRLGVYGGGGSKETTGDTAIGEVVYKRALRFGSGYTVAHIDYAFTPFGRLTIAPGVMVGAGSTTLEYAQTREGATFPGVFDPVALRGGVGTENNRYASIERSYFLAHGVLNFEYALTQFILLRAGAGYSYSKLISEPSEWTDGHGIMVKNVPEMTSDGLTLQFGLFVGLFQQ